MERNTDTNRLVTNTDLIPQTLKKISYGFYVVTSKAEAEDMQTRDKDFYAAGLVSWVSQCSFDPPMVVVAVQNQSDLHETIRKSKVFVINILGKADKPMISPFSKDTIVKEDRLNGYKFVEGSTGAPVLSDCPAHIECQVEEVAGKQGDHALIIGKVVSVGLPNPMAEPLMEWETEYHYGG